MSERQEASWPRAAVLSLCVAVATATATVHGLRDQAFARMETRVRLGEESGRAERVEALRHYVTREEWLEWRRSEGARRDAQYYTLLGEIRRLGRR